MITWLNGEKVFGVFAFYDGIVLQLNKINLVTKQYEFIDKTGTKYYSDKRNVNFEIPESLQKVRISSIRDLMIIGKEDTYE